MTLFRFAFIMFYFNTRIFKYVCMQNIKIICYFLTPLIDHDMLLWESFELPLVLLWPDSFHGQPFEPVTGFPTDNQTSKMWALPPSYIPSTSLVAAAPPLRALTLPTRTPGLTAGRLVHWPAHPWVWSTFLPSTIPPSSPCLSWQASFMPELSSYGPTPASHSRHLCMLMTLSHLAGWENRGLCLEQARGIPQ